MALDRDTNIEIRTTGAATNGPGFSGSVGTPQLSLSDCACTSNSTTITSSTGGFTSGMVGCTLNVLTTNGSVQRGQYLITGRSDTHTITVDRSPCPYAGTGGFPATVSAGTDYTQQASPQASGTHGGTDSTGLNFTDSTAGAFTSAMVGNSIWLASGSGISAGKPTSLSLQSSLTVAGASQTLATNLTFDFCMSQPSGNEADLNGGTALTASGSPGQVTTGGVNYNPSRSFNGSSQYFYNAASSEANFAVNQAFTIATRIYVASSCGNSYAFGKFQNGSNFAGWGLNVWGANNNANFALVDTSGNAIYAGFTLTSNAWHDVLITYSGNHDISGVTVYVDGSSVAITNNGNTLTAGSTTTNSYGLYVGCRCDSSLWFTGDLSHICVWSRVLQSVEISYWHSTPWMLEGALSTVGLYQVTSVTNANTVVLDRYAGGSTTGCAWALGGAWYGLDGTLSTLLNACAAGNAIWQKQGTYTLTANQTLSAAGSATYPITWQGYAATRGDNPNGSTRPLMAEGSYTTTISGNFWALTGLRFTCSANAASLTLSGSNQTILWCQLFNTNASGSGHGYYLSGVSNLMIGCEAAAMTAAAFRVEAQSVRILDCWAHDSNYGVFIDANETGAPILGSFIEQCNYGVQVSVAGSTVKDCTIANCGIGFQGNTAGQELLFNNLFVYNALAQKISAAQNSNLALYNNLYGNSSNRTAMPTGLGDTATDPAFGALKSWTDLASTHGTSVVTSVSGGLNTYFQVGDYICIQAGTNWVAGTYRITAISSGSMTLATDPTSATATSGIARTLRTGIETSDARTGSSTFVNAQGLGLALGVGAASAPAQGAWQPAYSSSGGSSGPSIGVTKYIGVSRSAT